MTVSAGLQAPAQKKPKVDASAAQGSSTVFVKNLPWSADEDTIAEFFGDCGTVANIRIGECRQQVHVVTLKRSWHVCLGHASTASFAHSPFIRTHAKACTVLHHRICAAYSVPKVRRSFLLLQAWTGRQESPGDLPTYNSMALRAPQQQLPRTAPSSWAVTYSLTLLRRGHRAEPPLEAGSREVHPLHKRRPCPRF